MGEIILPWPDSKLSNTRGVWYGNSAIIAKHRRWAFEATKEARIIVPAEGDIRISVDFYPPNYRMDRMNYWGMCKAYFDGVAEAMGVNDKRFTPGEQRCFDKIPNGTIIVRIG